MLSIREAATHTPRLMRRLQASLADTLRARVTRQADMVLADKCLAALELIHRGSCELSVWRVLLIPEQVARVLPLLRQILSGACFRLAGWVVCVDELHFNLSNSSLLHSWCLAVHPIM